MTDIYPHIEQIDKKTTQLLQKIGLESKKAGIRVFVVGGFVRDLLLNQKVTDLDFVVIGDAIIFCKALKKELRARSMVTYAKFGTCLLEIADFKLEFVSAREEQYIESSRKPKVKPADLHSDLSRRDFTINAIAMDISGENFGRLTDPFDGQNDLKRQLIRTPLTPVQTFSDDPLRMMRAVRFAARFGFSIEPETRQAITKTAERLAIVSSERITDEFNKMMLADKPSESLKFLEECGLMREFLPEFIEAKGIEQRKEYHHKDVFYHTLQVIDQIAAHTDKLELRLAALFHDIAKPRTKRFDDENGWTFYGHEVVGERMTGGIMKRMKYSNEQIEYVKKLVRLHLRPMALVGEDVSDSAIRRLLYLSGEHFDDLVTLCRADITSKNPQKVRRYLANYEHVVQRAQEVEERDHMRAFKSPVDGSEIMKLFNLTPGPLIGRIKHFIEEAILEGNVANDHDVALDFLLEHRNELDLPEPSGR